MITFPKRGKGATPVTFRPKYQDLEFMPGKRDYTESGRDRITRQRKQGVGDMVGSFYANLHASVFGGRVLRENEKYANGNHLYGDFVEEHKISGFQPDVLDIRNGTCKVLVEVKAAHKTNCPWLGLRQFTGYTREFMNDVHSQPYLSLFSYGHWTPEKLHSCDEKKRKGHECEKASCDNKCLIDRLTHSTREVLLLPHNLWSFLMLVAPNEAMDQTTSQSPIDSETYARPRSNWLGLLHEHWQNPRDAINEILDDAKTKLVAKKMGNEGVMRKCRITDVGAKYSRARRRNPLRGLTQEDFMLDDLTATSLASSDYGDFYALTKAVDGQRPKRVKVFGFDGREVTPDFKVTIYSTHSIDAWRDYLIEHSDKMLKALRIKRIYHGQIKSAKERLGRAMAGQPSLESQEQAQTGLPFALGDGVAPF